MKNAEYGVPQHELNALSSLLRDQNAVHQLVNWSLPEPQYWLMAKHFKTAWIGDAFHALLVGGFRHIEERLRAYPNADRSHVTADAVIATMRGVYQQRADAGDQNAYAALNSSEYWAQLHRNIRHLAHPSWPSNPQHVRHDAYVVARADTHPSPKEEVPFELVRSRGYDDDARHRELAVIGAILNDPSRAGQFWYTPSSSDASPYWLQPQDFGDPATAEIWDALVTGPDPAIALPEANDPRLTPHERAAAMVQHISTRLQYSDYHRATGDDAAKARLDANVNQKIAAYLMKASAPDFSPNPNNAARYAVTFILEPSIPAAVEDLAGQVREYGLADASLGNVSLDLSTIEYSLGQLAERLDAAPRSLAGYSGPDLTPADPPEQDQNQPSYTSRPLERSVIISLIQNPSQLNQASHARSLAEQDFTQPEHRWLFNAVQSLSPDAAQDPWLLADQAHKLARFHDAPALNPEELGNIFHAARTLRVPPAEQAAGHLITMTVRRTARDASTVIQAAAQRTLDPRALIDRSRQQFQQATHEALRYHQHSVPEPSQHNTRQATVA
ncbi:hypothetical protein OG458_41640 (plasmid) [Streptomyces sp. NBC_01281]|uniref:hypothetical protein n=1 Tax=Streptomyces sp. NBC_01281 TaxID=2903811 RepID=UPI002E13579A|nr:hypothetical protein OG458_41640 [Streptomyces sp. NBC_01281]